jgi:hypothetical protein
MKTLSDVLRNADPLRHETRTAETRQRLRHAVLSAPRATSPRRLPRWTALVAASAFLLGGAAIIRLAVRHDAVAAMRFEVRLAAAQEAIVDNGDILTADVVPGATPTTFSVALTFTPEGADKMRRATEAHIGERLELLVDGEVVMAPTIRSAISRSATLTGDYSFEEAGRIVEGLLKGKLEVRSEK